MLKGLIQVFWQGFGAFIHELNKKYNNLWYIWIVNSEKIRQFIDPARNVQVYLLTLFSFQCKL